MKRLIVNADDFGLTGGVNRAIIECHEKGAVSSTTIMVTARAAGEAAALAADHPRLGVGLHINLTSGPPALQAARVQSLVGPDGRFPGLRLMVIRLTLGLARASEVEAEIAAQIGRCRELGIEPTHVDSHHHLHAHPRLRAILYRECRRAGITKARGYHMASRSPKTVAISLAAAFPAATESLETPSRFSGIEEMGSRDMAAALRAELSRTEDSLEFMCHPGYADEELAHISSYSGPRQVELEALTSAELLSAVRDSGARLMSFRDL